MNPMSTDGNDLHVDLSIVIDFLKTIFSASFRENKDKNIITMKNDFLYKNSAKNLDHQHP